MASRDRNLPAVFPYMWNACQNEQRTNQDNLYWKNHYKETSLQGKAPSFAL